MADIVKELSLNYSPKNYKNNSLYYAKNVKINKDGNILENENSLIDVNVINNFLNTFYGNTNLFGQSKYIIKYVLACNNELLLFIQHKNIGYYNEDSSLTIVRYNEESRNIAIVYGEKRVHEDGTIYYIGINHPVSRDFKITADFTYNVDDALIISFCIYIDNNELNEPLSTINLGIFNSGHVNSDGIWIDNNEVYNDRDLIPEKLSNIPEVKLPLLTNLKYCVGKAYTGWYYIFIRYKINHYDYTQWYSIGPRFPVTNKTLNVITKINGDESKYDELSFTGFYSKDSDICGQSFKFDLVGLDVNYDKYQLGFIVSNKTLNKNLYTEDIDISQTNYIFNSQYLLEDNIDINSYINYNNVKNIVNKQNKLYISNFKTRKNEDLSNYAKNVKIGLKAAEKGMASGITFNGSSGLSFNGTVEQLGNLMIFLLKNGVHIDDLTETIEIRWSIRHVTNANLGDRDLNDNILIYTGQYMKGLTDYELYYNMVFKENNNGAVEFNDYELGDYPEDYLGTLTVSSTNYSNKTVKNLLFLKQNVNLYTSNINIGLDYQKAIYGYDGNLYINAETGFLSININGVSNIIKPADINTGLKACNISDNNGNVIVHQYDKPGITDYISQASINAFRETDVYYLTPRFFNSKGKHLLTIYAGLSVNTKKYMVDQSGTLLPTDLTYLNIFSLFYNGTYLDNYDNLMTWRDDTSDHHTVKRIWGREVSNVDGTTYTPLDYISYIANYNVFSAIYNNMLSSIIPGEIYDFYIHYIDKYGISTDGYRLNWKDNGELYTKEHGGIYGIMPVIINGTNDDGTYYYCKKLTNSGYISADLSIYWADNTNDINLLPAADCKLLQNIDCSIYLFYKDKSKIFIYNDNTSNYEINYNNIGLLFINNSDNNLKYFLYHVEFSTASLIKLDTNTTVADYLSDLFNENLIQYEGEAGDVENLKADWYWDDISGYDFSSNNIPAFLPYYNINNDCLFKAPVCSAYIDNVLLYLEVNEIPEDYVGYFISYKKLDLRLPIYGYGNQFGIYSNSVNIDRIIHPIACLIIQPNEALTYYKTTQYYSSIYNADTKFINVYKKSISFAGDNLGGRLNLGTIFKTNNYNDVPDYKDSSIHPIVGLVINKNIYTSTEDVIYRIGNIFYNTGVNLISQGLMGFYGADDAIIYNNEGVTFVNSLPYKSKLDIKEVDDPQTDIYTNKNFVNLAMLYAAINRWSNHILDSRYINYPTTVQYHNDILDNLEELIINNTRSNKGNINSYIMPINSIDTWQEKLYISDELNPYPYIVYRKDIFTKYSYDKTLRISNIISDETKQNRWRNFTIDEYKFITENKGNIIKLIDLGTWLFVHTEHSLFGFDTDNWMKTLDKNVNLQQQEVMDIQYKEFFSEKLGYGGLKHKENSIKGTFGYIWYDKDHNKIYRLDGQEFIEISAPIKYWLDNIQIHNILFLNDIKNERLLVYFETNQEYIDESILSYNYKLNVWVSFHSDYVYNNISINTKEKTYFIDNNSIVKQINPDIASPKKPCEIQIIVNDNWEVYKFLEYIEYKFKKLDLNNITDFRYNYGYLYELLKPYSGELLEIKNDNIAVDENDTPIYDLEVQTINEKDNYLKPYYKLGDWRFNCLRNLDNRNIVKSADDTNRIYGNYFIFKFTFNTTDLLNIESFKIQISQFENQ